ncbi:MAG TPA: oligosaccharide flippase family protein [Rhizomicrobium sp.]|nr:oligosaccharide flippase family protein [Rhizomicrobium sp.]
MSERAELDRLHSQGRSLGGRPDRRSSRRFVVGAALLSSASVSKLALQCVLIPVFARLLGPDAFGLMSLAMSFVLLANMLSDGGMASALVRVESPDPALESTVYWISAIIGLALAAAIALAAWPLSRAYSQPELFYVMLALAPILVASSCLSVANARIVRWQRFDAFAAGDVGCAALGAAVGLTLAFRGFGVWSLVGQQLAFWSAKTAWVSHVAAFRPAAVLRFRSARPLLRFSANNLAANIADFVGKNVPVLIVGGALGVGPVARYAMAYQLSRVAEMVVSEPVSLAAFSAVAATKSPRQAAGFVLTALRILMLALAPLFCGLALTADLVAQAALGPRWTGAGPAIAALTPGALLLCLYRFATAVLLGAGRAERTLKLTVVTAIALALGTLAGVRGGVTAAILGFSLAATMLLPLYVRSLARPMRLTARQTLATAIPSLAPTAAMALAVLAARAESVGAAPFERLGLSVVIGALVYGAVAFLFERNRIRADLERLRALQAERTPDPDAWPYLPAASDRASSG